jgi:hypothetical protein
MVNKVDALSLSHVRGRTAFLKATDMTVSHEMFDVNWFADLCVRVRIANSTVGLGKLCWMGIR